MPANRQTHKVLESFDDYLGEESEQGKKKKNSIDCDWRVTRINSQSTNYLIKTYANSEGAHTSVISMPAYLRMELYRRSERLTFIHSLHFDALCKVQVIILRRIDFEHQMNQKYEEKIFNFLFTRCSVNRRCFAIQFVCSFQRAPHLLT